MSFINMDKRFKISKMLIDNYIFILLMLVIATHKGSNAFGYDSAASCSPNGKLSRRGRAQMLAAIPCDLARQPYCNLPGAAYPWHAVRRFVHENQGLMKRMYGDMRHISVLRDEIQNNEIDIEDIEMAAERYSRSGFRRSSKFMHQRGDDFTYGGSGNLKNNDIIMEPHFRPVTTTTTTSATATATTTTTATKKPSNRLKTNTESDSKENIPERSLLENARTESFTESSVNEIKETTSNADVEESKGIDINDDKNLASNSVYELPTLPSNELNAQQPISGDNIEIIESPQLNVEFKNLTTPAALISATLIGTKIRTTSTTAPTTTTESTTISLKTTLPLAGKLQTIPKLSTSSSTSTATATTTRRITSATSDIYHRRRPQYPYRQRPKPQQQQSQQQHAPQKNFSAKKPSQTVNESERIPSTPSSATIATASSLSTTSSASTTKSQINFPNKDLKADLSSSAPPPPTDTPAAQQRNDTRPYEKLAPISSVTQSISSSTSSTFVKPKIELLSGEKFRKQPVTSSSRPSTAGSSPNASATRPPVLRDGQLFQDTLKQEPAPVVNLRGVNACPVKEEVVAPFWANNTRGEVLALLNLYPFEQYVHWEKCTHEHKQMYCRDGCRCEQQYRLHRLLAYDPRNECRGIFSDWFRFPSCCICKCYNVPMEFRATSRSPRMQSFPEDEVEQSTQFEETPDARHPLEIAEADVKRAIYEHATEDWYRPSDYDENENEEDDGVYWDN